MTNTGIPPPHQDEPLTGTHNKTADLGLLHHLDACVQLLNISHLGIVCIDRRARVALFNQGAERLFGYRREDILGLPFTRLICRDYRRRQKHRLAALVRIARDNRIGWRTESIICARNNGERFPTDISLSQGLLPDQRLFVLVVQDTSERLRQAALVAYQAEHDQLTDLPNRALLYERLRAGIARADRYQRKLGVVYLDLDQFKPVNDRYGHASGDNLLQAVAQRLSETVRKTDTVSRIGGDEFIICLEQINSPEEALAATAKIAATLRLPFSILGRQLALSASIGVAVYPDHGEDLETLLRRADLAMYHAKRTGGAPQLYQPGYD